MRCIFAIVAMVGLGACKPGKSNCESPQELIPGRNVFGIVGHPLTVELVIGEECPDNIVVTIDVSVTDPDNLLVALDGGTRTADASTTDGVRTAVTFIPAIAGAYHIVGTFEPDLGVVQKDILVAEDHTADTPAFTVPISSPLFECDYVDVTPQSHLLCLGPQTGLFSADGTPLQTMDAIASTFVDGSLWLQSGAGEISRWVEGTQTDGGPGFVRDPDTFVGASTTPITLFLPTESDVLFFDSRELLTQVAVTDGGLADTPLARVATPPDAAWRAGGTVLFDTLGTECRFSVDAGLEPCVQLPDGPRNIVALGPEGMWDLSLFVTLTFPDPTLHVISTTSAAHVTVPDDCTASTPTQLVWESGVALETDGGRFVPALQNEAFTLSAFPSAGTVKSVSSGWVTLSSSSGLQVYRR